MFQVIYTVINSQNAHKNQNVINKFVITCPNTKIVNSISWKASKHFLTCCFIFGQAPVIINDIFRKLNCLKKWDLSKFKWQKFFSINDFVIIFDIVISKNNCGEIRYETLVLKLPGQLWQNFFSTSLLLYYSKPTGIKNTYEKVKSENVIKVMVWMLQFVSH